MQQSAPSDITPIESVTESVKDQTPSHNQSDTSNNKIASTTASARKIADSLCWAGDGIVERNITSFGKR